MSVPQKDRPGEGPKRPPDKRPESPASKRLRERVSFFEKVWSRGTGSRSSLDEDVSPTDAVEDLERRLLAEERARCAEPGRLEHVALRHTDSPRHVVRHLQEVQPDGSIQARNL